MTQQRDYSIFLPGIVAYQRAQARKAHAAIDAEKAQVGEAFQQAAHNIFDEVDRSAAERERHPPDSERERRQQACDEARKKVETDAAQRQKDWEARRAADAELERQRTQAREQAAAERRAELNSQLIDALRLRYLASGGIEEAFAKDLPTILAEYRRKATLDGSTDPKEEFAAWTRSNLSGGRIFEVGGLSGIGAEIDERAQGQPQEVSP